METVDDVLAHYGIKGMKWGVRRTRAQIDDSADVVKKKAVEAKLKSNRGSTDALSNEELKSLVNRLNLEQQYSNLTSNDKTKSNGKKFVSGMVENMARQQIQNAGNKIISYQVETALAKKGLIKPPKKK
jgi:hypothetical protein